MKRGFLLLISAVIGYVSASASVPTTELWDGHKLENVRKNIASPLYKPAYDDLIKRAEKALVATYKTVMDKEKTPPRGTKHDYMSLAIYFWPDSTKPGGTPYKNRDGIRNPELKKFDAEPKSAMIEGVLNLSLANYFSANKKYGQAAEKLLYKWFLDPATRMNPNLDFAQHIPGICDGRGIGIIDTYNFVSLTDAIRLLHETGQLSDKNFSGLKQWFSDFTTWLMESKNGKDESMVKNNHGTAYDVQLSACALFAGKKEIALSIMQKFAQRRMFNQIEPDGSQPLELSRTLAYHYSWYNLTHMIDMAALAKKYGIDITGAVSPDGRCIDKALAFLTNYIGKQSEWKWQQIHDWNTVETELCQELRKMASITSNAQYEQQRLQAGKMSPYDIHILLFPL